MKVHQLYTESSLRNFTYIIEYGDSEILVIDPYDAKLVEQFVATHSAKLTKIINTHEHWDHVGGNLSLKTQFNAQIFAHQNLSLIVPGFDCGLKSGDIIWLEKNYYLQVLDTPGHTMAHVCLLLMENSQARAIFCGDTLFNAGIGHVRLGGNKAIYFETIKNILMPLDDGLLIYPGHDYMENNLNFTFSLDPENVSGKAMLARYNEMRRNNQFLVATLGEEKLINLFFRYQETKVKCAIGSANLSDFETFSGLRDLRDKW